MKGFNFGQIGDVISQIMDSDYIDIKRDIDGTLTEVYSNISCHISYNSTDNPDANSIDVKPILQSITVNLPNWVDVQNNDFIIAKKIDSTGNIIQVYSGRCGNPVVSQARKKFIMTMNGTDNDDPTPIPPEKASKIEINYLSDNSKIKNTTIEEIEVGTEFNMPAPSIDTYNAINSIVDGVEIGEPIVYIASVSENGHVIDFIYEKSNKVDRYSFLIKGLFTKNDGSLFNGYHLYKKVKIDNIENTDNVYTITSNNEQFVHEDSGKDVLINIGTKLVLLPTKEYIQVNNILSIDGNKIKFTAEPFTPTEDEKNAYITGWYD